MSKKKLLQKGVAFSILLPFSCGIALPAIESSNSDKPVVYAMTKDYDGNIDDVEFSFEDFAVCSYDVADVSTASYISEAQTVDMVVSKVNLNVRSSPSTSASVLGLLASGDSGVFVEKVGDWYKIEYSSGYGYVSANTSYSYIQTVVLGGGMVESLVNLNVRSSPSTTASKVGMLYSGESASYIETVGSWYKILFDGNIAYVSASSSYSKLVYESVEETPSVVPDSSDESSESEVSTVVYVATSGLNVRSAPSTSGEIYGVATYGETYAYKGESNGWYQIEYNGKTAYLSASYCQLKETADVGVENNSDCDVLIMSCVSSLNVRSSPSTSSTCVGSLDKGDMVYFVDLENGWYQTIYKGVTAYVSASDVYTSLAYFETGSTEVEDAIDVGYTLLGTPYVYGATRYLNYDGSLNSYFTGSSYDCSSMVQYIYASALGIELGSTSRLQSLDGVEVAVEDIKRGDLLFFTNSDRYYNTGIERIGHVAIYLGNNYILHTASDYAVIEEISATRWSYFITARDVISTD